MNSISVRFFHDSTVIAIIDDKTQKKMKGTGTIQHYAVIVTWEPNHVPTI